MIMINTWSFSGSSLSHVLQFCTLSLFLALVSILYDTFRWHFLHRIRLNLLIVSCKFFFFGDIFIYASCERIIWSVWQVAINLLHVHGASERSIDLVVDLFVMFIRFNDGNLTKLPLKILAYNLMETKEGRLSTWKQTENDTIEVLLCTHWSIGFVFF